MNYFRLDQPLFGWIMLLAVPLLAAFFYWSWRVKQKLIAQFVQSRLLPTLTVGVSPARQKFRLVLLTVAVCAVLAALAGPQWGFAWEEATQRGLDIIVAVDTSRSMLAADAAPNRLEKAKLAAFDLMRLAKDDRLGLVAFAGSAFLQCPLTLDDEAFRQGVAALNVGIIPQGGTALSEAIRTAEAAFEKGNNNHKVLILFTDGEDHDADADTLAEAKTASEAGLNIFTVGVGTAAGELLRVADEQGNQVFVKDDDGNVVKSHLNETLLQQIATAAGGFYLPLIGANPMETLYNRGLAPLPKSESTTKLTRVYHERYHWFLGFAVLCLVAEILLPDRARSRRAESTGIAANPGLGKAEGNGSAGASPYSATPPGLGKAAAIGCLLLLPALASASTPGAFDKYKSGDYQGAFDEYNRLSGLKTNDYRLHYNAGTAAYRAEELDAAEKQLGAALNSPDIANDLETQEHAYFNLGNTLYHQGESASDSPKKQERWGLAITNYAHALQLNTNDTDARNNLAFVKKQLEELKKQEQQKQQQPNDQEPSEAAKAAKARADEAVKRRQYKLALDIMEESLKSDPTTQTYGDYIKRLQEVNGVAVTPHP